MKREGKQKGINTAFRISVGERERLEKRAAEMKISPSELIRRASNLYLNFDESFLEQMEKTAIAVKLDVSTTIQQLMTVYVATDAAIVEKFGISKTFERAFQYDQNGLITGNEHAKKVKDEVLAGIDGLMGKLKESQKIGKEAFITKPEAVLLAARV